MFHTDGFLMSCILFFWGEWHYINARRQAGREGAEVVVIIICRLKAADVRGAEARGRLLYVGSKLQT